MGQEFVGSFPVGSIMGFAKGVLLLDDCEGACNWSVEGTDAGVAATNDTAAAFMGAKGLKVTSGATDPAEGDYVAAKFGMNRPETGLLVFRGKMRIPDLTKVGEISLGVHYFRGGIQYTTSIDFRPNTPIGYYRDAANAQIEVAAWNQIFVATTWMAFELVIDTVIHKWISATLADVKMDLSAVSLYNAGAAAYDLVVLWLQHTTAGANAALMYYDNLYAGEFLQL